MNIILLGSPGAGKNTQAELLSKQFSIPIISAGNLIREEIKNKTSFGKLAEPSINRGEFVPDKLITEVIEKKLKEESHKKGFLLEGFPRTVDQAKILDAFLKKQKIKLDAVLKIICSQKTVVKRLTGRLICDNCGAVYHIEQLPPAVEGYCDECESKLQKRTDDTEQVVQRRLSIYRKRTLPLVDYYDRKHLLKRIDGEQTPDMIFREILWVLGE